LFDFFDIFSFVIIIRHVLSQCTDIFVFILLARDLNKLQTFSKNTEMTNNLNLLTTDDFFSSTDTNLDKDLVTLIDIYTNESVNYIKVTSWLDGTPIATNEPLYLDGIIYRKKATNVYYARELIFKGSPLNVKYFGAKGDGIQDDTPYFQKAIDFLTIKENVSAEVGVNRIGGKLYVPEGVYPITELIIKSNIRIEGANCYSTRFKPIGATGKYVFNTLGTTHEARMMYVTFENFTISPSNYYANEDTRSESGGINLSHGESIKLNNIIIMCLKGPALNQVENYDCNITDCTFKFCDSISFLSGQYDVTNAIHISGCRFEAINQIQIGDSFIQQREINFSTCKFEHAYININGAGSITFAACHFTSYDNNYAIIIKSVPTDPNLFIDSRGISLSSCSFLSPNGKGRGIKNDNGTNVSINGCTASFIEVFAYGGNFNISNCILFDCTIPEIAIDNSGSYLMLVSNSSIINTRFAHIIGNTNYTYPIRLYGKSQISNCVFEGFSHNVLSIENVNNRITFNRFNDNKENQIKVTGRDNVFLNNIGGSFFDYLSILNDNQITENHGVQIPIISSQKFGSMRYTKDTGELYINNGTSDIRIIDNELLKVDQRNITPLQGLNKPHTAILSRVGFNVSISGEVTLNAADAMTHIDIILPYKPFLSYIIDNNIFKFILDKTSNLARIEIGNITTTDTFSFIFDYQAGY